MTLDDLGDPWKVHTEAEGLGEADEDSCMKTAGIYDAVEEGGRYAGAAFQRGDSTYFVASVGLVFRDVAGADAMVEHFTTQEYADCSAARITRLASADPGAAEGASWRVSDIFEAPPEGGDGGFAGTVQYQFQGMVDGEVRDGNGATQENLFRRGRTVLYVTTQAVTGEADAADLADVASNETTVAAQKAIARASE